MSQSIVSRRSDPHPTSPKPHYVLHRLARCRSWVGCCWWSCRPSPLLRVRGGGWRGWLASCAGGGCRRCPVTLFLPSSSFLPAFSTSISGGWRRFIGLPCGRGSEALMLLNHERCWHFFVDFLYNYQERICLQSQP